MVPVATTEGASKIKSQVCALADSARRPSTPLGDKTNDGKCAPRSMRKGTARK
jgi:hypothetical protein